MSDENDRQKELTDELAAEMVTRFKEEGFDVHALCLVVCVDEGEIVGTTVGFAPLRDDGDVPDEDAPHWLYLGERLMESGKKSAFIGQKLHERSVMRQARMN